MTRAKQAVVCGMLVLAWACSGAGTAWAQVDATEPAPNPPPADPTQPAAEKPDEPTPDGDSTTSDDEGESSSLLPEPEPIDPALMRLYLMDGAVVAGKFSIAEITVDTDFGTLTVPITKVRKITPGLESHSHLSERIDELVAQLGGDDFQLRETAQKDLVKLGPPVRDIIRPHGESENAEQARRVKEILKQLDELDEEFGDNDGSSSSQTWIEDDTVVTSRFTAVGKISPQSFTLTNQYGTLNIDLADIKYAQKPSSGEAEDVRKSLSIDGTYLAQLKFKPTGVRVEKGDKISVSASGRISRSGSSSYVSGPEGSSRFSYYNQQKQIYGGTLVARIGSSGSDIKVGSKAEFTAPKTGMLRFAIGMRPDYVGRYQFIGNYSLKVQVERGGE